MVSPAVTYIYTDSARDKLDGSDPIADEEARYVDGLNRKTIIITITTASGTDTVVLSQLSGSTDSTTQHEEGQTEPQNIAPQGTLTIRDGIHEHRAVDIDAQCSGTPAGACTRVTALTQSFSTDDGTNWRARNVDLRTYGDMWIYNGRFPYKHRRPVDRSVVDAATARAHEYNAHINVARDAVIPLINEFLGRTFRSAREFNAAADQLSGRVTDLFRRTLRETQDRESNR